MRDSTPPTVIVVCADSTRQSGLSDALADTFDVVTASEVAGALAELDERVACIVTAEDFPDGSGVDLAARVRERDPDLPVVLVPKAADGAVASAATAAGVTDYLPDPLGDATALRERVEDAVATYRRRREQAENSDMFTSMLESLPVAIYVKDAEARHLRLSDVPGGADPAEAYGKTDVEVHGHENSQEAYEDDLRVIETGEPVENKPEMHATDGIPVWLETTKVPWRDEDGSIKGLIGVTHEITHLKQTERELRRRIHWLERFTDYVTHDLRNPLHVAQGNLELARLRIEGGDADVALDTLGKVEHAIDRMDSIIENVYEMAETVDPEADASEQVEPLDFAGIVDEVWGRLETAENTLVNEVPPEATLYAVRSYLYPLVENLFKNAVEHAGPGATVTVGLTEDGFYVADDGPGLPEEKREKLSRPGYSTDDDSSGTGLNIVADIVVAHGWDIDVGDSEAGGARFAFGNCLLVAGPATTRSPVEELSFEDSTDVGDVTVAGSSSYDEATGRWTVSGAGLDLWRDTNEFHYVYRTVEGSVRITARVPSVERVDEYSKGGLMIRDDLSEDAAFGYVGRTATEEDEVLWRGAAGDLAVSRQFDRDGGDERFRLTFEDGRMTAAVCVDGDWEQVDQRTVETDGSVFVGLAVCSVTPRYLCEAVFEDVAVERLGER